MMKKVPLLLSLTSLVLLSFVSFAQTVKVQGLVNDETGFLPYATLKVNETTSAADAKGRYTLYISAGIPVTIKISSSGYKTLIVQWPKIQNDTTINWILQKEKNDLNEVVVSATRKAENIRNIVASVTLVSKKKLETEIGINPDLTTILANQVPGIAPSGQAGNNTGQVLRGRPMLVMIDGVSQSSPLRNGEMDMRSIDPSVLQQIEVVKGATAIYGNGAAGGLVNYVTMVPDTAANFAGKTDISYTGSGVKLKNSVGGRVSQMFYGKINKFDYIISGVAEQTGEYKDAKGDVVAPNYSLGETDLYNAFAKIGYQPTKNQRIQVVYNYFSSLQNSNYTLVNGNLATGQKATAKLGTPIGVPTGTRYNHNFHLSYKVDSLFLNSTLTADAYYTNKEEAFYVSAGRFEGSDGQSLIHDTKKGARLFIQTPVYESNSIKANIAYGVDYLQNKASQPLIDGRIWVPTMDMTNLAPFVQADIMLFKDLIFKTGYRYEHVNIDVDDYRTLRITNATGATVTPALDVKGGALKYNTGLFNAGFKYNRLPFFSPFVSYSQGFSVMDVGLALRGARVDNINKINTEAVVVNNYEIGFETRYQGLTFTATAYRSTSKLGSEWVYNTTTQLFQTDRSPEEVKGFELAATYVFTPSLAISGSYSYMIGRKDLNGNGKYNDPEDSYLNGRRISAPKVTGSVTYNPIRVVDLTLNYTGIISHNQFAKNATTGLYNSYEGPVHPYNLFNFAAGYKVNKNTRLSMGVENLLNEDYFPAISQWIMLPNFYLKGRGRAMNLTLSVRY